MTSTATSNASTTFCLGRFLIDVPAGAYLYGADYKYDFAQIEMPKAMTKESFEKEIEDKEFKLKSIKHLIDQSLLKIELRPDPTSRIFAFWEKESTTIMINLEGYRWINGVRFLIADKAGATKQEIAVNAMRDYLPRLRPRADTEIPSDPGYCFQGGFIANERWKNEEVNISFRLPQHPDATLLVWFYTLAAARRDKPLLERVSGAAGILGRLMTHVHVLRQGDREIGGFKGQEYLTAGPNSGGLPAQMFKWETEGEGTLRAPAMRIELQTGRRDDDGNPRATSLSNEEALKLWDSIVSTLRVRPTSATPAQQTSDAGPSIPLGEMVSTGLPCPQTGWWICADEGAVEGGRRQFFRQGQAMPQAVLTGEPSLWQKLKGERPSHAVSTVWTLAAYDDPKNQ